MGLFSKKKQSVLADLNMDDELEEAVNYNSVLDYLVGLSDQDYDRIGKVAVIYREANAKACEVLEVPNEPTTFINPPKPEKVDTLGHPVSKPSTLLDEDDELEAAFLTDDEPKPEPEKSDTTPKKVEIKTDANTDS